MLDQQQDALQKGLGRAVQWVMAGRLNSAPLLHACLIDQRYDIQCEGNRGEWLWGIINSAGLVHTFRDPVLEGLRNVSEERNAYQLCELARHFAENGDAAFTQQLYDFVGRRQIADSPSIGMGQLLHLEGEDAFRFIARLRGNDLATEDWEWHDDSIVDAAVEQLGRQRVEAILDEAPEAEIRRFAAGWREHVKPPVDSEIQRQAYDQKMREISADDVVKAAQSSEGAHWFRGWGMDAPESDLEQVLERIWTEHNSKALVRLLRVFSNRPLPTFDPRLIELCHHADVDVRRWASNALEQNVHPLVRRHALAELQEQTTDRSVVDLFIRNYQEGDEQRLLDQLKLPDDLDQRHWMLMDLTKVLEQNESADSLKLGQIIYFHTPCQICRFYAAQLLRDRNVAPAWLMEECRLDSNEDCRSLDDPKQGVDESNSES